MARIILGRWFSSYARDYWLYCPDLMEGGWAGLRFALRVFRVMLAGKLRAGGRTGSIGTLTATMTSGRNTDTTDYNTGFCATGGGAVLAPFGSMTSYAIGSDTVAGIYWQGSGYSASDSPVHVSIAGNKPSGSVSSLFVDGLSMGAVTARSYNVGTNKTIFIFGSNIANPFGLNGSTHSISLS